ncbi:MAG: hypothetical protein IPJ88_11675 [Myxococcales bacterium]|nr:MAG: hypothetical protein IPJ88_11675 [Myxococcales bacterium]
MPKPIVAITLCVSSVLSTHCSEHKQTQSSQVQVQPESSARIPTQARVEQQETKLPEQAPVKTETLPKPIQEAVAAAEKEKEGPNDCDQAYRGLSAAMEKLRANSPEGIPKSMPKYEVFMEHCESLPPGAQQCLVLPYALSHQAECRKEQDNLDDPSKQKLQSLLQGEAK